MKKYCIFLLYWIMNILRYFIITPFLICKYLIGMIHYIADIGLYVSLFNPKETHKSLKDIMDDIVETKDIYLIIFLFIIVPGFFFAIPIFILRHAYLIWKYIEKQYLDIKIENIK